MENFKAFNFTVKLSFQMFTTVGEQLHRFWRAKLLWVHSSCCSKAGKLGAVRTRGGRIGKSGPLEHAQLANQIQGFRIPDRSDT